MKVIIIILVILLVAMFITKPSGDSFDKWYKKELSKGPSSMLQKIGAEVINVQSMLQKEYKDYYIFSVVETRQAFDSVRYLGIFGMWIEI